ncbi:MAG: hypothetical protein ACOC6M_04410 [Halobacteriota archaeon]
MAICPFCRKDVKHLDLAVYIEEEGQPVKTFEITLFIGSEGYEIPEEINEDYVNHFYKCSLCKSTLFDNKEDTEEFVRHGEVPKHLYPKLISRVFKE